VLLAVDNRFTHFVFCVRHEDSDVSIMNYDRNSEENLERERGFSWVV
jgi:hypothetical protein